ncbi:hypothetical protein [Streptomyces sp. NPDC005438]|uniref:hypothetical protein n=1 Tax=Streptomyces sp. NPDC005438 TaxID=3156880 RepID=UPI0033B17FC3
MTVATDASTRRSAGVVEHQGQPGTPLVDELLCSFTRAQLTLEVVTSAIEDDETHRSVAWVTEELARGTDRLRGTVLASVEGEGPFREREWGLVTRMYLYARLAVAAQTWREVARVADDESVESLLLHLDDRVWSGTVALREAGEVPPPATPTVRGVDVPWTREPGCEGGQEFWSVLCRYAGHRLVFQTVSASLFRFGAAPAVLSRLGAVPEGMRQALTELRATC